MDVIQNFLLLLSDLFLLCDIELTLGRPAAKLAQFCFLFVLCILLFFLQELHPLLGQVGLCRLNLAQVGISLRKFTLLFCHFRVPATRGALMHRLGFISHGRSCL